MKSNYTNLQDYIHPDGPTNMPFIDHLFKKIDEHIFE